MDKRLCIDKAYTKANFIDVTEQCVFNTEYLNPGFTKVFVCELIHTCYIQIYTYDSGSAIPIHAQLGSGLPSSRFPGNYHSVGSGGNVSWIPYPYIIRSELYWYFSGVMPSSPGALTSVFAYPYL